MGADLKKKKVTTIHEQYVQERAVVSQQNAKKKKYLVRRLTVFFIFACVLTGYLISSIFSQASAVEQKQKELQKLEAQLEKMQEDQTILEEQIQKLNDDEYLGQLARKYYYLSDDNEIIFDLPEEEESGSN
ncbi:cell division protein DivIC [Bacillus oleivorans]|uniref:Cell division protein DivIC n=1 Tax=Bacillus oleivorans TaxID=1448271 RepID=A0A285D7A1_9BACI|nr:septum formation initiator family protein [Bacillus oleivorans]SNX75694.1 cell division protein DivIC [Bacillus oleivorans]